MHRHRHVKADQVPLVVVVVVRRDSVLIDGDVPVDGRVGLHDRVEVAVVGARQRTRRLIVVLVIGVGGAKQ